MYDILNLQYFKCFSLKNEKFDNQLQSFNIKRLIFLF